MLWSLVDLARDICSHIIPPTVRNNQNSEAKKAEPKVKNDSILWMEGSHSVLLQVYFLDSQVIWAN